jgi:hypothetical protein
VRAATTRLKRAWLEPWTWRGRLWSDKAATLVAGDWVVFSDDLVTDQVARVQAPMSPSDKDGAYTVTLREFDIDAYYEGTQATDTVPSTGTPWDSDQAPVVSTIHYNYGGNLYNLAGSDGGGGAVVGNAGEDVTIGGTGSAGILPNSVPLYGKTTAGAAVGLLMVNSTNQIQLGNSGSPLFFAGSDLNIDSGAVISGGVSVRTKLVEYSSGGGVTFGDAITTTIKGTTINLTTTISPSTINVNGVMKFPGSYSQFDGIGTKAGLPTTSDIASGHWAFYYNTSTATMGCFFNVAGTIVRVG